MKLKAGHLVEAKLKDIERWNNGIVRSPVWIKLCDGKLPHYVGEFEDIRLKEFQPIDNGFETIDMNRFLCVKCGKMFSYKEAERHTNPQRGHEPPGGKHGAAIRNQDGLHI